MKKLLLLLLLLIPISSVGQVLQSVDFVRKGYYDVIVADTVYDSKATQKECLELTTNLLIKGINADCQQPVVDVVGKFGDAPADTVTIYDTTNVQSLTLRQVNMGYQRINGERALTYDAEAHGDSVLFEYFHNGQSLQKSLQYPKGGIVRDTLKDPPIDSIQVWVHGYWDKWVEPYHEIVDIAFLDTLGQDMATYVLDNFEDTDGTQLQNHTPDTDAVGNGWSVVPLFGETNAGDTDIQNNEARVNVDNTGAVIDAGQSDVSVWAEWYPPVGGTGRATIPFRYSDADNHWLVNMREENGDIGLSKIVNGSNNFHVESTSFTWNEGQTYQIEVRLSGDSIRVFVDGTEVTEIARTDNFNNTATQYGIGRATSDGAQPYPRFKVDDGGGFGSGTQTMAVGLGATTYDASMSGTASAEISTTHPVSYDLTESGTASAGMSTSHPIGYDLTEGGTASGGQSVQLPVSYDLSASSVASAALNIQAAITYGMSVSMIEKVKMSVGLGSYSLDLTSDNTAQSVLNVSQAVTYDLSTQMSAQAAIGVSNAISYSISAASAAAASMDASMGYSLDITVSAQTISTEVTLADGRTFTISAEIRTFTPDSENRTFTIASENRTLSIDP